MNIADIHAKQMRRVLEGVKNTIINKGVHCWECDEELEDIEINPNPVGAQEQMCLQCSYWNSEV